MIIRKLKYLEGKWILSICLLFLFSCQESSDDSNSLRGRWGIDFAERNGKPTLTLEDAFIEFQNDSILTTNILRKKINSPYKLENKQIIQSVPMEIIYDIAELKKDSLVLLTTIRGYKFKFSLSRDSIDIKI